MDFKTINRYDKGESIGTDLDPIEDLLNLVQFLKSSEYTSELLSSRHGWSNANDIKKLSKLISRHADVADGLAEQAYSGPAHLSFLPLYYSSISLAKILIMMKGNLTLLERDKRHGAKYFENEMRKKFLKEKIKIWEKGTIPTFYHTLSGRSIPETKIDLDSLYSNISAISAEYRIATGKRDNLLYHRANVVKDQQGTYLKLEILTDWHKKDPPSTRKIKAYKGLKKEIDGKGNYFYHTNPKNKTVDEVRQKILTDSKRYLISDYMPKGITNSWISSVPISGRDHVFPEEFSILLAYFHLSNVVRYNPEHLERLTDSIYWPLLLGIRKHGFFIYLKLMWGNYNRYCFDIY